MIFVIVWFLDHFTLEYVPSVNSIWVITPAVLFHVWITKFKTIFIFFKLSILTSNNVMWVGLLPILFNKAQAQVINLFIKPQNFLLLGLYLIVFFFNGLLMVLLHFACKLLPGMRKQHITAVSPEVFCLWLLT